MVEVTVRFEIGSEEVGPLEAHLRAILAASEAELLEWNIYDTTLLTQDHGFAYSLASSPLGSRDPIQS